MLNEYAKSLLIWPLLALFHCCKSWIHSTTRMNLETRAGDSVIFDILPSFDIFFIVVAWKSDKYEMKNKQVCSCFTTGKLKGHDLLKNVRKMAKIRNPNIKGKSGAFRKGRNMQIKPLLCPKILFSCFAHPY